MRLVEDRVDPIKFWRIVSDMYGIVLSVSIRILHSVHYSDEVTFAILSEGRGYFRVQKYYWVF